MINEVNWIIHEATTVFYSTIKLETVITNQTHKKILQGILGVSFAVFALLRLNIGRLRFSANTTMNNDIAQAHSYAFIIWGFADLIIFILLIKNTLNIGSGEVAGGLLVTLLKSSLPRIMILVINTFVIVILGQLSSPLSTAMNNLNSLAWSIKGAYPILLMFDMHTTKDMLLMKQSKMTGSSEMTSAPAKSFHNSQRSVNVFNPPSYPSTANPSAYV
ncbi:hypothetical protein BC833DRAFT_610989 [Globomyces pollinis-pini]|nr:hypothetical protein BC833DRAFT_610989 [Globomyces pollinis-pini]